MKFLVRSPSNIAWIKYMGKEGDQLPTNPSLSATLSSLCTRAAVETSPGEARAHFLELGSEARTRAERFAERLSCLLPEVLEGLHTGFEPRTLHVVSENTFPSSAGIASSASAFSAMTVACALGWAGKPERLLSGKQLRKEVALKLGTLARLGSGSASRSLLGPFVKWDRTEIEEVRSNLPAIQHAVWISDPKPKEVSSSDAHRRVRSSLLFAGRATRARTRLEEMELALLSGEFSKCAALAWEDWVDMHALFQTARPPFGYLNSQTLHAIQHPSIKKLLESGRLLITLDAGPHPHFFWIEADLEVKYTIEKLVSETGETLLLDQLSSGPQVEILL